MLLNTKTNGTKLCPDIGKMISHKYKCIFVHIPRCAGTSMEINICGKDWWRTEGGRKTKHLISSTAKRIYEPYWNDYFKFSFVRNPWDRMVSMGKCPAFYGVHLSKTPPSINFNGYLKKFPKIEVDPRSQSCHDNFSPEPNSVYLNILNEELDYIGKFENLQEDFNIICDAIGKPRSALAMSQRSKRQPYSFYYNDEKRKIVEELYAKDIEHFGYEFGA